MSKARSERGLAKWSEDENLKLIREKLADRTDPVMKSVDDLAKQERQITPEIKVKSQPTSTPEKPPWLGNDSPISQFVQKETQRTLNAYREQPSLVEEHFGIENAVLTGGYGHRQIFELVQNGADALWERGYKGKILVRLTQKTLYCANEGSPIEEFGAKAILASHISSKRGEQIGHFGLGFKSVLAICDRPEFYSRSGSFGFERKKTAEKIKEIVPYAKQYPTLRCAYPLDINESINSDPNLYELAQWATTIVKLPLTHDKFSHISEEISDFPSEFMLFSPHVNSLIMENQIVGKAREINITENEGEIEIEENGKKELWRVFKTAINSSQISKLAREDADARWLDLKSLPLIWAVPLGTRRNLTGRFWAFFPTKTEMSLAGILNAPWKTNADRENLLAGPFNSELLQESAKLVSTNLRTISDVEDPAKHLDYLPARERDKKNDHDEILSDLIYTKLSSKNIIPNTNSQLCFPTDISLRPEEVVKSSAVGNWLKETENDISHPQWCHVSVEKTKSRRFRSKRLGAKEKTVIEWLEAAARPKTPDVSITAISLFEKLMKVSNDAQKAYLKSAKFILTSKNMLVSFDTNNVFLPLQNFIMDGHMISVHPSIAKDLEAWRILKTHGIAEISSKTRLESYIKDVHSFSREQQWIELWRLCREISVIDASHILSQIRDRLKVKTVAGRFHKLTETLMPGSIVPGNGSRDANVAVDQAFHRKDLELLDKLGVFEVPKPNQSLPNEYGESNWYHSYLESVRDMYLETLPQGKNPRRSYLDFMNQTKTFGPLDPFFSLTSDESKTAFSQIILSALASEQPWKMGHKTSNNYAPAQIISPTQWLIINFGQLPTSLGPRKFQFCVGPGLAQWEELFPVAKECSSIVALRLGMPKNLEEIPDYLWKEAFDRVLKLDKQEFVTKFYLKAAELTEVPKPNNMWCRIGLFQISSRSPSKISVTYDETIASSCQSVLYPIILVARKEDAELLQKNWGLKPPPQTTIDWEASEEAAPLLDIFPGLSKHIPPGIKEKIIQPCRSILVKTEIDRNHVEHKKQDFFIEDHVIYYDVEMNHKDLLARIAEQYSFSFGDEDSEQVLDYLERPDRQEMLAQIRKTSTIAGKLSKAVSKANLFKKLPEEYARIFETKWETISPERASDIALAIHGLNVLKVHSDDFASADLNPPSAWYGSKRAIEFVEELGFPREYAGFQQISRESMLEVDGPISLKPLHDFQAAIANKISEAVLSKSPNRGLLSLPTGAGKTRVVAEALINVLRESENEKTVIWIAQSDELCEQAVQTWREIWQAIGPRKKLRISRLWGSTNDRVTSAPGRNHLVVATFQSLIHRVGSLSFKWLKEAFCVIIDEAHGSTTKSYTSILTELGISRSQTSRHLIGLTATPFRGGEDETETERLVNRYGSNRFDHGVLPDDDPYPLLQKMGVLSLVEHKSLPGISINLDSREMEELENFKKLPSSVEHRLGKDTTRNKTILDAIVSLPKDWPVLVFAASVDHAHLLAVMLSIAGIPAQGISSATDMRHRRHYIEEFKKGNLRVLTNYNVLTTGFDAPAIRALIIARPVYSRGLYQQMIGRGLRGPLNGGKEKCLIVNVADNIDAYGEQMAFRHFEYLWENKSAFMELNISEPETVRADFEQMLSKIEGNVQRLQKASHFTAKPVKQTVPNGVKTAGTPNKNRPKRHCPVCNQLVRTDRMEKHLKKAHRETKPRPVRTKMSYL